MAKPAMNPNQGTLTLDQDPNNIHYGDKVSGTYVVGSHVYPGLYLTVLKNGVVVQSGGGAPIGNGYAGNAPYPFPLGNTPAWPSGEGEATMSLVDHGSGKVVTLAEVSFHVLA